VGRPIIWEWFIPTIYGDSRDEQNVAFTTLLVLKGEEEKTCYYHHQHRYKPTAGSCHIMSDSSKRPTWWFILLSSKWVISGLYPLAGKVLLIHLAEQQKEERFTI